MTDGPRSGRGAVATGLVVRFGSRTALDRVSMTAPAGAVTAVVGGDGAGKTTLLRCLMGRVPLASGTVDVPDLARIGYLPATVGSWRGLTVQQNVEFVGGSYGLSGRELAKRAAELLEVAGLAPFSGRTVTALSGGMRRKLGFVMAMMHRPDLLVLDEPSTGVDPVSRVDLWRLISGAAASGTAIVLSTTYLDEAERASSVLVLDEGRELLVGSPSDLTAGVPGRLTQVATPTRRSWAWRRGRGFRELWPPGTDPVGDPVGRPDLEDAVVAATVLRRNEAIEELA